MIKHNFRQLIIWKDAISLSKELYALIQKFPPEHKFGISGQMFRAAVSIASNIAEGTSRNSQKEFLHFLRISLGSAFELETQILIALQCNLIQDIDFEVLTLNIQKLQKQISAFSHSIETKEDY